MKEAAPQHKWEDEAERRIKQCDIILVMVGGQTYKADGVLKEVEFAREYNKLIAYKIILGLIIAFILFFVTL